MKDTMIFYMILSIINCDTIKINNPKKNAIINTSSFIIDYTIERNDQNNKLLITNTTTEILDTNNNSLVSFNKRIINRDNKLEINVETIQKSNKQNFTIQITGFGKNVRNKIVSKVPIQLYLDETDDPTETDDPIDMPPSEPTSNAISNLFLPGIMMIIICAFNL